MTKTHQFNFQQLKLRPNFWLWVIFFLVVVFGFLLTLCVGKAQDIEMRENLIVYAKTIEQTIDWQPFSVVLNTNPELLKPSDLKNLEVQLNSACKANKNCHFIYLLYGESSNRNQHQHVNFLLDASPQQASEISHLGDLFFEATDGLKNAMSEKTALVEGPVIDRWGTWVTASVPLTTTRHTNNFVMLSVDVAVTGWNKKILIKMLTPFAFTLSFLGILSLLMTLNNRREQAVNKILDSTSQIAQLVNHDPLTGLPNRRLLEDRLDQALKAANRSEDIVAVFFLDLDFFKAINDIHGHLVGDQLLKDVAIRLKQLLRSEDTVARIGGDEFILLLPKIKDELQAIATAEKIVHGLTLPFAIGNKVLVQNASIGIALYPQHGLSSDEMIKYADDAMYIAKRHGRNCFRLFS